MDYKNKKLFSIFIFSFLSFFFTGPEIADFLEVNNTVYIHTMYYSHASSKIILLSVAYIICKFPNICTDKRRLEIVVEFGLPESVRRSVPIVFQTRFWEKRKFFFFNKLNAKLTQNNVLTPVPLPKREQTTEISL